MVKVVEPATEEVMAELPQAGVEETDAAVARAKEAFPAWRRVTPGDRADLMRSVAAGIRDRAEELALLEARNAGKPIADARGEIAMVAETFRYYAGGPERLLGDTIPVAGGDRLHIPRAARRRRADHAVELPAGDRLAGSSGRRWRPGTRSC